MVVIECGYEPPHTHEYPEDWEFGGANNLDPRSDRRYVPTTYIYLDANLREVWSTQTPLCLDQALDEFTKHASIGATYLQVKNERGELELVSFIYDRATDTVNPL